MGLLRNRDMAEAVGISDARRNTINEHLLPLVEHRRLPLHAAGQGTRHIFT